MIGHAGRADRAEVDGVVLLEPAQTVGGHHRAGARVVVAAPGQVLPQKRALLATGRLEHPDALRDHLRPHTVAADHGDPVFVHSASLSRLLLAAAATRCCLPLPPGAGNPSCQQVVDLGPHLGAGLSLCGP